MGSKITLMALRKMVTEAREKQSKQLERKKLNKELFELQNPGIQTFKKGFISGAKALGRGTAVTAKGIQKFAVKQQEVARMREKGRRMAPVAIKQAARTRQKAFQSVIKPRLKFGKIKKKGRKVSRVSRLDDFGIDNSFDSDFGF